MPALLPWIAHFYTATGTVWALLATAMTFAHNFRSAFIFLVVATFVDSTDGVLARAFKVKERLPQFDGALLDNIIDYMTYVFVPALIVWQANLVPVPFPVCAAMLLSSAYGFAHTAAKVDAGDHFFTGFPSYWNIVVVVSLHPAAAADRQRDHPGGARDSRVRPDSLHLPVANQDAADSDVDAWRDVGGAHHLDDLPAPRH